MLLKLRSDLKTALNPLLLLLFCAFTTLSGCVASSGAGVSNAISAPTATTTTYKTYAWYQQPTGSPEFEKGYSLTLDTRIRRAVEEELQKKGLQKVSENPDVLVAYDVSVSVPVEKDAPGTYPNGFGYSYGYMVGYRYNYSYTNMPGFRAVDLFKQGTLIIDMVSAKGNELVWRGWTEGAISNFNANYKTVHNQVEQILEQARF